MSRRVKVRSVTERVSLCSGSFLKEDLENGEEVATCPSCSLIVKVIYDKVSEHISYLV